VAFASRKHKTDPAEIVAAAFSNGKLREPPPSITTSQH